LFCIINLFRPLMAKVAFSMLSKIVVLAVEPVGFVSNQSLEQLLVEKKASKMTGKIVMFFMVIILNIKKWIKIYR